MVVNPQALGGGGRHPLLVLIEECLDNITSLRPDAVSVLGRLNHLEEVQDDLMGRDRLHLIEELQRLRADYERMQVRLWSFKHCVCVFVCIWS